MSTKQDSAQPLHDATKQGEKHDEERETNEKKKRKEKKADCFPTMQHTQQTNASVHKAATASRPSHYDNSSRSSSTSDERCARPARNLEIHQTQQKNAANSSMETPSHYKQLNGDVNRTRSLYNMTHYQRSSAYLRRATTVSKKKKGRTER